MRIDNFTDLKVGDRAVVGKLNRFTGQFRTGTVERLTPVLVNLGQTEFGERVWVTPKNFIRGMR